MNNSENTALNSTTLANRHNNANQLKYIHIASKTLRVVDVFLTFLTPKRGIEKNRIIKTAPKAKHCEEASDLGMSGRPRCLLFLTQRLV